MNTPTFRFGAGLIVSAMLAACSAQATTTGSPDPAPSTTAGGKVSANTVALEEMTAAFTSAGVPNPQAWAEEVIGHRPFPIDDVTLDQLRRNLLVHDPSDATLDAILGALVP